MDVALKCTYNDAKESDQDYVGFYGTCSRGTIMQNIADGHVLCTQPDYPCQKWLDIGFKGPAPKYPCYESRLFKDWEFGAGYYHNGPNAGEPIRMAGVEIGDIAILTTRFPNESKEPKRRIIGLFQIGDIDDADETVLKSHKKYRVRLKVSEARQLYFWQYYYNKNAKNKQPRWGSLLFRYLDQDITATILAATREVVSDKDTKLLLDEMLSDFLKGDVPQPQGPLKNLK